MLTASEYFTCSPCDRGAAVCTARQPNSDKACRQTQTNLASNILCDFSPPSQKNHTKKCIPNPNRNPRRAFLTIFLWWRTFAMAGLTRARAVICSPRSSQSSSHNLLQHLHWLPIKHRINFKIANITFRTLQSSQPVYLRSVLHTHHSTRSFRLSNTSLSCAPFIRTSFGSRIWSHSGWNDMKLTKRWYHEIKITSPNYGCTGYPVPAKILTGAG